MSVLGELDVNSICLISFVMAICLKIIFIPKKNNKFKTGYVDNKRPIPGTVPLWVLSSVVFLGTLLKIALS